MTNNYLNRWTTRELLNYYQGKSCLIHFDFYPHMSIWTPDNNVIMKDIKIKLKAEIRQFKLEQIFN